MFQNSSVSGCPPTLDLLFLFMVGMFSGVVPGEVGDVPVLVCKILINCVIKFSQFFHYRLSIFQSLVSVQYLRLLTPLVHSSVWHPHPSVSYLLSIQ